MLLLEVRMWLRLHLQRWILLLRLRRRLLLLLLLLLLEIVLLCLGEHVAAARWGPPMCMLVSGNP